MPDTDPSLTHTIDTRSAPREGEGLVDRDEHERLIQIIGFREWDVQWERKHAHRMREEIASLRAELAKRDETIAEQDDIAKQLEESITGLRAELAKRDDEITDLESTIYAREQNISRIDHHRDEAEAKVRNLRANLAARDRELVSLRLALADLDATEATPCQKGPRS